MFWGYHDPCLHDHIPSLLAVYADLSPYTFFACCLCSHLSTYLRCLLSIHYNTGLSPHTFSAHCLCRPVSKYLLCSLLSTQHYNLQACLRIPSLLAVYTGMSAHTFSACSLQTSACCQYSLTGLSQNTVSAACCLYSLTLITMYRLVSTSLLAVYTGIHLHIPCSLSVSANLRLLSMLFRPVTTYLPCRAVYTGLSPHRPTFPACCLYRSVSTCLLCLLSIQVCRYTCTFFVSLHLIPSLLATLWLTSLRKMT